MTCKDCIHHDVCDGFIPTDLDSDAFDYCREGRTDEIPDIEERCTGFKDKSRYIELPCKVGDTAYCIRFDKARKPFIKALEIRSITTFGINTSLVFTTKEDTWGTMAFATKEEAERALKERSEGE